MAVENKLVIPKNLSDQIYDIILKNIIAGKYKAGDRIDTQKLVKEFNISRSPIKDALNKLHGAGIIDISPRIGHYVRKLTKNELVDLFEFRLILETSAIRKALRSPTEKEFDLLRNNVEQSIKTAKNSEISMIKIFELDKEFHRILVSLAQNYLMSKIHNNIHILSHAVRTQFVETHERTVAAQNEHKEILESIESKDIRKIESAITMHLKNAENFLLKYF
ncbi:MAG TPA: GntR family transcriptional regulator [bacterium]|nr:GntR family transcriptional regulator [bacterium]